MESTRASAGAMPLGSHGKYAKKTFAVPAAVKKAAKRGLQLREVYGRGGTEVGLARARQLSTGSPKVTLRDLVHMRSYFRRHAVDNLTQRDPPSNGWIAWLLWGGDAARDWAEEVCARELGVTPSKRRERAPWEDEHLIEPSGQATRDVLPWVAGGAVAGVILGAVIGSR